MPSLTIKTDFLWQIKTAKCCPLYRENWVRLKPKVHEKGSVEGDNQTGFVSEMCICFSRLVSYISPTSWTSRSMPGLSTYLSYILFPSEIAYATAECHLLQSLPWCGSNSLQDCDANSARNIEIIVHALLPLLPPSFPWLNCSLVVQIRTKKKSPISSTLLYLIQCPYQKTQLHRWMSNWPSCNFLTH